jgi:hypothetical protein
MRVRSGRQRPVERALKSRTSFVPWMWRLGLAAAIAGLFLIILDRIV